MTPQRHSELMALAKKLVKDWSPRVRVEVNVAPAMQLRIRENGVIQALTPGGAAFTAERDVYQLAEDVTELATALAWANFYMKKRQEEAAKPQ